ncbi:NADH-quinone oxidoreductase subunit J [Quadrisphaera sp. GCM10027208]|uniref:NADH-quinone oxidoreductase subunit J n=1 Tax=Quadrisphaera sp. GCM10027208 TaxID=3273423 RepID=UPI003619A263|nr:NADH-quinone oxidoreductase subunit J [Kineosporiaceae bacterium SCSIO 59966]
MSPASLLTAPALAQVPLDPATQAHLGTGETVLFWVLAPLMVIAALGLLFAKKAVHAALMLVFVMISLAVLYAAQEAPFLFVTQIIVYTGAVMILFLFVLMLVGVDSSDSLVETIRGHRVPSFLAGIGLAVVLVAGVTGSGLLGTEVRDAPLPVGLAEANADGNPVGIARLVFSDFVIAFELTGALLVTAALGAVLLTHRPRLTPRVTQRELAARRVREGTQVTPLPAPGVFARHNGVDIPALLPDGTPSELSVSRVLRARGQTTSPLRFRDDVRVIEAEIGPDHRRGVTGSQFPTDEAGDASTEVSDADQEPGTPQGRQDGADR